MTIYDYLELCNNTYNMIFTLFDVNAEDLISVATDNGERYDLTDDDLKWSDYSDCEIYSMDIWYDGQKNCVHIEFNIEIDEEDY